MIIKEQANNIDEVILNNTNNKIYLGNVYGNHIHDGYAGAVFHTDGIIPIITTCQGEIESHIF